MLGRPSPVRPVFSSWMIVVFLSGGASHADAHAGLVGRGLRGGRVGPGQRRLPLLDAEGLVEFRANAGSFSIIMRLAAVAASTFG